LSYLVDTNVYSELAKQKPEAKVVEWLRKHERDLYISTVTVGEIRRGVELLPDGKRKAQLRLWLQSICECMKGRVLSFNTSTAHIWGQLKANWDKSGITVPSLDSQIAATAQRHGLTVVTRNTKDFAKTGVKTLNPFAT
jgi:predicted nucleic acid-binding protein